MKTMQKDQSSEKKDYATSKIPLSKNIIAAFIFFLLILAANKNNPGYKWLSGTVIKGNLELIKKYKDLTFEQKLEAKLGFSMTYLNFVKNNTPADAVILLPPRELIKNSTDKTKLDKNIANKIWVSNFLYPRVVIYEDEKETSPFYSKITHIGVINGWGYHLVNYDVTNKQALTVLKVNK